MHRFSLHAQAAFGENNLGRHSGDRQQVSQKGVKKLYRSSCSFLN